MNTRKDGKFINLSVDDEENAPYQVQLIVPVVSEGDPIGAVVLLSKDANANMGEPLL